jgi:hypothetical protein
MTTYRRAPGVLVEPLGPVWAAFSAFSGETLVLNDESAAILEVLEAGSATSCQVTLTLATDSGVAESEIAPLVQTAWQALVDGGLVLPESAVSENVRL